MQDLSVALSDGYVSPGEGYLEETPVLRPHAGTQPDLFLRWNRIPFSAEALDVVIHLHGFSQQGGEMPLAEKVERSGLDLSGRARPTLAMRMPKQTVTEGSLARARAERVIFARGQPAK